MRGLGRGVDVGRVVAGAVDDAEPSAPGAGEVGEVPAGVDPGTEPAPGVPVADGAGCRGSRLRSPATTPPGAPYCTHKMPARMPATTRATTAASARAGFRRGRRPGAAEARSGSVLAAIAPPLTVLAGPGAGVDAVVDAETVVAAEAGVEAVVAAEAGVGVEAGVGAEARVGVEADAEAGVGLSRGAASPVSPFSRLATAPIVGRSAGSGDSISASSGASGPACSGGGNSAAATRCSRPIEFEPVPNGGLPSTAA